MSYTRNNKRNYSTKNGNVKSIFPKKSKKLPSIRTAAFSYPNNRSSDQS